MESSAQISFTGELAQITDDYTQQIAVMLGLANDAVFSKTGVSLPISLSLSLSPSRFKVSDNHVSVILQ